jgi:hypothetical protein
MAVRDRRSSDVLPLSHASRSAVWVYQLNPKCACRACLAPEYSKGMTWGQKRTLLQVDLCEPLHKTYYTQNEGTLS